jgi:hypothetical protein
MRTNYVLIDFESVQPRSLDGLEPDHFRVLIFVGASQAKIPFDVAHAVQRMGVRAEYVRISGNGSNALDFHIAFYIGQYAAADSTAYFHIISKDAGFDPLIAHLKDRGIYAGRVKTIADITLLKVTNSRTPEERIQAVVARLQQMKEAKPRAIRTLRSTIAALFQKQLKEAELDALVEALVARGLISIATTKIAYSLPTDG